MIQQPYFRFDRRIIGVLETAKRIIEGTAIGSTGAAWESGRLDTLAIVTGFLIVLRIAVSYIISVSVPTNPIQPLSPQPNETTPIQPGLSDLRPDTT